MPRRAAGISGPAPTSSIPAPGPGRPHKTDTKLGKLIQRKGLKVYAVGAAARIAPRTMTELLAGRSKMTSEQCARLCLVLGCKANEILE